MCKVRDDIIHLVQVSPDSAVSVASSPPSSPQTQPATSASLPLSLVASEASCVSLWREGEEKEGGIERGEREGGRGERKR